MENSAGGTISDLNGKFSLNARKRLADDFVHQFRQEGTESEEGLLRNYAGRDANLVDEVVVVGYGTQKR